LCERARAWSSLRADGELSELESALLDAHLCRCTACRSFADGAAEVAAALRAAGLERPAPLALVLPRRRRPARRALQAVAASALLVVAGTLGTLAGFDRQPGTRGSPRRVAVVAASESPDVLRELRRPLLVVPVRPVPRNRRVPPESI
jgi:predicted anti-sigma-YlaC factor YlaD